MTFLILMPYYAAIEEMLRDAGATPRMFDAAIVHVAASATRHAAADATRRC